MGSLDGAEVAELVGLYLLSQLSDLRLDISLYCDDGLGVGTCHLDKQKKLCQIFKENGLNITAEANLKNVNFLYIRHWNLQTIHTMFTKIATIMKESSRTYLIQWIKD